MAEQARPEYDFDFHGDALDTIFDDYTNCDGVTLNTAYTHTPFTARVETMMRSIADKIATRTAIPNNSAEVGFVNQLTCLRAAEQLEELFGTITPIDPVR